MGIRKQVCQFCSLFGLLFSINTFASVDIYSQIASDTSWQVRHAVSSPTGQSVKLKVNVLAEEQVRWFQIIPDTSQYYKNANHPWEKNPYKWAGFGKVNYHKKRLNQFDNLAEIEVSGTWLNKNNVFESPYYHANVGSFWFQVEVIGKDGRRRKSMGLENNDHRGLNKQVLRVSFTQGEGYLGVLSSFFNVPAIFGSVPYQSQHYLGLTAQMY
ncbi:hypothetical protein [Pseudoalteromonas luteoviolacea]|uniref:Uncharacterized protein n=1 Tax=Pseudoalteromonas luteoviolacea (strain 2ta16) TaxID=1353533 RepID=V4HN24_PSEL2|nr:hypothetical protein [Pseudoalteromonas luteoviolacea]ESP92235.1 hypothetical protein PL2TA16_05072 [Pseudoalteromonas luteoviolacea 2ta16]KZN29344.1 hypothetical protein N483_07870 [Pseudoalteromonas luteoviolacea NCIMB 1944]